MEVGSVFFVKLSTAEMKLFSISGTSVGTQLLVPPTQHLLGIYKCTFYYHGCENLGL